MFIMKPYLMIEVETYKVTAYNLSLDIVQKKNVENHRCLKSSLLLD